MTDNIVQRLTEEIDTIKADPQVLRDAIVEIKQLNNQLDSERNDANLLILEIQRLREAGDALAESLHGWIDGMDAFGDDAERLRAWEDARRG